MPTKTIVVHLKDGGIITGEKDSRILQLAKLEDIESIEWKVGKTYEPNFVFHPNANYRKS